ncbi:hypothetical protein SRHO_G00250080 [Serrasalmus rhombeus]
MAPKKQLATQSSQQGEQRAEDESSNQPIEPTSSSSVCSLEQVCGMLQDFMKEQRGKEDLMRKEAAKNEQRWRTMQHQFSLLQGEVHRRDEEKNQVSRENEAGEEPNEPAQSQILRCTHTTSGTQRSNAASPPQQQFATNATWPSPRMPMLKESDDIEQYLTMFERMAQAAKWPVEIWAVHLVPLLDGKARAAYVAMEGEETGDYSKIKGALLRKYEINKETYRQRFRVCAVQDGETPRELFTRLKSLYEKWMTPQAKSKEEIGATIIMEQYLSMVSPELRRWIIERNPSTAVEAVHMAEAFVAARLADGAFTLGKTVNKPRHYHEPAKENSFTPAVDNKETVINVKIDNKMVKALIDTGASQTLVAAKCVPNVQLKHESQLRVKCIHGDEQMYPTADVNIEIDGQTYLLNVGVLEKTPYAVILGRDLPILIDLLAATCNTAEAYVVTRGQAKQSQIENSSLMQELPFNETPKSKKSRKERRRDRVRGTVMVEQLIEPEGSTGDIPERAKNGSFGAVGRSFGTG